MKQPLGIHLFGPFEALIDGHPLTNQDWRSQQTRSIFKILITRRGQVVSSDQIIDLIWPEDDPDSARKRLHVRISQLRNALGDAKFLVQTVDGGYLFTPDSRCWIDADGFQTTIAEGRQYQDDGQQVKAIEAYEKARQIYRGDYLVEDLYADWAYADREFYRERFITLLTELAECYAQQGRYRMAIARCQEAISRDPVRESIYVRLMLYHYYAGERSQSVLSYERLQQILSIELGIEPLETTKQIADQIRNGTLWANKDTPRYPPPIYQGRLFEVPYELSETPFVGREREYAWLIEKWQDPNIRVIFLAGEAGIGKSKLIDKFIGYITSQGFPVLKSRVLPEKQAPLGPVISLMQSLIHPKPLQKLATTELSVLAVFFPAILEMFPNLPRLPKLSADGEKNRLFDALASLIESCSSSSPLLLIDDAHRLSPAACEILAYLSDLAQVLLSFRSEEAPSDHPIYQSFPKTKKSPASLVLEPLHFADVRTLIQKISGRERSDFAQKLHKKSEGNPLFMISLLQHMFDEGQLFVDSSGGWEITEYESSTLPPTLQKTIENRLQRLNRSQRRVLDFAAVFGGEFDFPLFQQAIQLSEEILLTHLDELIDKAMIVEPRSKDRAEFSVAHDRYTEVVYETLPGVRRKQIHLQVANAMEQGFADELDLHYPSLADHFGNAEVHDKEQMYAALAGEQAAAQFENMTALHYFNRALELTPKNEIEQRYRLLIKRESVFDLLGDRQSQQDDLDALISLTGQLAPRQQAEIHLRRAAYAWILGNDVSARTHLDQSTSLAQSCGAPEIEAASLLLLGRGERDQTAAREYLEEARTLAKQNGLIALEGDIVRCLGNACFWQNSYQESRTYFEEALSIHREVGDLRGELSALNNLGLLSQNLGDPKNAVDFYQQGLKICNKIGDRLAEGVLLGNSGSLSVDLGAYDQAETWLRQACDIRTEIKNDEGVGSLLPILGNALQRQGKFTDAKEQLERALEINTRIQHVQQQCLSLDGLSRLYCELGSYDQSLAYLNQAFDVFDDEEAPNRIRAMANGSLLYHLMGDSASGLQIGERAVAISQELPQIQATALTNLGHIWVGINQLEEGEEMYQKALEIRINLHPHLIVEPLAGLAQIALITKKFTASQDFIKDVLTRIEAGSLDGPDQPAWVYLTCYRVLRVCQDLRATRVLNLAYKFIQNRAAQIENLILQQSYLENVQANREILQLHNNQ